MENQAHHRDRLDASFRVVSLILQEVESIMVLILAFSSFLSLTTAVSCSIEQNGVLLW